MKRRTFLKGTLATGTVAVAVAAGLLTPSTVLAAWPKAAFEAKSVDAALEAAGFSGAAKDESVKIGAPDIAEKGSVVPVTISGDIEGVTSLAILAKENNQPLTSIYDFAKGTKLYISTRIKMVKSSDVIAVVKVGDKLYSNSRPVKVTLGGCGG